MAGRFPGRSRPWSSTLGDGSSFEASIADGDWLAWWQGALDDATAVRGLDDEGRLVRDVSIPGG